MKEFWRRWIWMLGLLAAPALLFGGDLVTGATKHPKFERGDKILFATDFKNCPVGEIPEEFDDLSGSMECVRYKDHIWIAPLGKGTTRFVKRVKMGNDRFSLDFRVVPKKYHDVNLFLELYTDDPMKKESRPALTLTLGLQPMQCFVKLEGKGELTKLKKCRNHVHHIALQARRHQLRVFVDGRRVAVVPLRLDKPLAGFSFKRWGLDPKPYDFLISDLFVAKYSEKEKRPSPEKLGIRVEKTAEGAKLTVPEKVLFDFNEFILKPEAKEALEAVAGYIQTHPAKKIVVTGYTDNVGGDAYNLKLSLQRAQSVADYLIYCEKVDPKLFKIEGKGKADPVASNATEEGRAKNRRVEIRLIE